MKSENDRTKAEKTKQNKNKHSMALNLTAIAV